MELPISNAEHIYRKVRSSILEGELEPGDRLMVRALCKEFGTSNSPVIDAIRRLELEGLVVSRPNVGAQVKEWSADEVVRSYMMRNVVDSMAARLFVQDATDKQRQQLRDLNEKYRQATLKTRKAWAIADAEYHMHIIDSVMPTPVRKLMEVLYAITITLHNALPIAEGLAPQISIHDELTEILMGNDPDAAGRAMFSHVSRFNELVKVGIISQEDIPQSVVNTVEFYESMN